jgi:tetratricopeptide (TPR) repeat protein
MRALTVAAVFLVSLFAAGAAFPQDKAQLQKQAEEKNAAAKEAYNAGDFAAALRLFKEAHAFYPSERYLFNAAKSCTRLKDYEGTIYFYERYLQANPVAADRAVVTDEIAQLRKALAAQGLVELTVTSTPAGAAIAVPIERKTEVVETPGTLFLAPGKYVVTLTLAKHKAYEETVTLTAGMASVVQAELEAEETVEPDRGSPWQTAALVAAGVGAAAAVGGGVLMYLGYSDIAAANSKYDDKEIEYPTYSSRYSDGKSEYVGGLWLTIGGGALAAAGLAAYLLLPDEELPAVTVQPLPDGLGITVFGSF